MIFQETEDELPEQRISGVYVAITHALSIVKHCVESNWFTFSAGSIHGFYI